MNRHGSSLVSAADFDRKRADKIISAIAVFYFSIGLTVAFIIPIDMLDRNPWARSFVEFMSFIPYVQKVGMASSIPQIAQFCAAVMWAMAPAVFFILLYAIWHIRRASSNVQYGRAVKYFLLISLIGIFILTGWEPSVETTHMRLESNSILGIGILGSFRNFGLLFLTAVAVVMLRNWRWLICGDEQVVDK